MAPGERDLALVGHVDPGRDPQQRRLAHPPVAEDRCEVAGLQRERHVLQDGDRTGAAPVALADSAEREERCHRQPGGSVVAGISIETGTTPWKRSASTPARTRRSHARSAWSRPIPASLMK